MKRTITPPLHSTTRAALRAKEELVLEGAKYWAQCVHASMGAGHADARTTYELDLLQAIDELCAAERRDNANHSPDPKKRSGT